MEEIMKNFLKKFEDIYSAVAFAEAGEHETAKEILRGEKRTQKRDKTRKQLRAPGIKR
jgi:hypothetical protein